MGQSQIATAPESVSEAVVQAVADAEGIESTEVTDPLYEAVDPGALDRLFSREGIAGQVMFSYNGYEVTVSGEGAVSVASVDE